MKWIETIAVIVILCLSIFSCTEPPDYPNEPTIEFLSLSRNTMEQSQFNDDSLTITFGFTDGDGNLGSDPSEPFVDVFLTDDRDGFLANQYRIPFIPEQGVGNGISGEISIVAFSTCCITEVFPPCFVTPSIPTDTLTYSIQIMDRDSNFSNVIKTSPIILGCD
jgi:hypothetical protein